MFAIYGTSGRLFHGPFEELRQVAPILRSGRVRAIQSEDQRADPVAVAPGHPPPMRSPSPPAQQAALHAYEQARAPAADRQPLRRVREVMTHDAVVVTEDAELGVALERLARSGFAQGPVVDAQDRLVGLLAWDQLLHSGRLTELMAGSLAWADLMRQTVGDWMLTPVPSVEPDTDIRRLAVVLLETGLDGLPVVQADGLVSGFVSRSDILRAVTHDPPLDLWAR